MPIPPSSRAALAGAEVLLNLSASNITIGKARQPAPALRQPVAALHRRLYLFRRRAGRIDHRPRLGRPGGDLRERRRCWPRPSASPPTSLTLADVDLGRLRAGAHAAEHASATTPPPSCAPTGRSAPCAVALDPPAEPVQLQREVERFPYVPADPARLRAGLLRGLQHPGRGPGQAARGDRLEEAGDRRLRRARFHPRPDRLRRAPWTCSAGRATDILAYTLPGFATSEGTKPTPTP